MDDYPAYSLDHNIPLLVTIGLPPGDAATWTLEAGLKEQATLVRSEFPMLEGDHARAFGQYITGGGAAVAPWQGRASVQRYRFRVRTAGRTYYLPPRRSRLPENFEATGPVALHSPFSPLSPSCGLYPDGLIDAGWVQKHQEVVPSVFLVFYGLTADATTATLHDNQIKTDIAAFRTAVQQSGCRSRVAVAIFGEEAGEDGGVQQERLEAIRKGSGTEAKLFFVMAARAAAEERGRVAENLLTTLYGPAVEHYRELGRHARKKRGRGSAPQPSVPPTSGTSQTLSLAGWQVRYDVKAAVLAEFRQELDTALRLLDAAYGALVGTSDSLVEAIPSWSRRWNEARLLADVLAVRRLRCLLLAGSPSAAVRAWEAHRDRMRDLVDARGRGTAHSYGWAAWEARWALVVADLIRRVGVPGLGPAQSAVCLPPERALLAERLAPWHWLHHPGYWYRLAAHHLAARRALARAIPEADRRPPDASPASLVARRAIVYDDYMCPPPHEEYALDHGARIVACLEAAGAAFLTRRQTRMAAEVALACAREHVRAQHGREARDLLAPLWADALYRREGWFAIAEDLAWTLRAAAAESRDDANLLVAIDWELLDQRYTRQPGWPYDVSQALSGGDDDDDDDDEKKTVHLDRPSSFLSAAFVFRSGEGKAGEVMQAQLAIRSNAHGDAPPIVLAGVRVRFAGSAKPVRLQHAAEQRSPGVGVGVYRTVVPLEEGDGDDELLGTADLTLYPQSTVVYEMAIHLREAGDARAAEAVLLYSCARYRLQQTLPLPASGSSEWFLTPTARLAIPRADSHAVHILPRPPKLEIQLPDWPDDSHNSSPQYYTNEPVELAFVLRNAEAADASVQLDVVMYGSDKEDAPGFTLLVAGDEIDTARPDADQDDPALLSVPLGVVAAGQSLACALRIPPVALSTTLDVTLRAVYRLVADPATPITQTRACKLALSNPFEANYDLLPRLHPAPWPSLFDQGSVHEEEEGQLPRGLVQAWTLVTRYASFAAEDLQVVDLALALQPVAGVVCKSERRAASSSSDDTLVIRPQTMEEAQFDLAVQKTSLDHREPVNLDVSFVLRWRRVSATTTTTNTTTLPVPRLALFGSEPRVLAAAAWAPGRGVLQLDVAIENASGHFLTFGLSLEPSAEFAFAGPKLATVHVLPVSRRTVAYRLLPLVRGAWIRPALVVRDKYFQKVLRILPTGGMKMDKEGLLLWVPGQGPEQGPEQGPGQVPPEADN